MEIKLTPTENAWAEILDICCTGGIDEDEEIADEELEECTKKYGIFIRFDENWLLNQGLENHAEECQNEDKKKLLWECIRKINQDLEGITADNKIKDYIKTLLDQKTSIGETYLNILCSKVRC